MYWESDSSESSELVLLVDLESSSESESTDKSSSSSSLRMIGWCLAALVGVVAAVITIGSFTCPAPPPRPPLAPCPLLLPLPLPLPTFCAAVFDLRSSSNLSCSTGKQNFESLILTCTVQLKVKFELHNSMEKILFER